MLKRGQVFKAVILRLYEKCGSRICSSTQKEMYMFLINIHIIF